MIHKNQNLFFKQPKAENGDEFICCNFAQKFPYTKIFEGNSELIFRRCNLTNCDIPKDSVIDICQTRQVEFCANLHTDFDLDAEDENCSHVIDYDDIIIDGVLIQRIYQYQDKEVE